MSFDRRPSIDGPGPGPLLVHVLDIPAQDSGTGATPLIPLPHMPTKYTSLYCPRETAERFTELHRSLVGTESKADTLEYIVEYTLDD